MAGTHNAQWNGIYTSDLEDGPKASTNGGYRGDAVRSRLIVYCCPGDTSNPLRPGRAGGKPESQSIIDSFLEDLYFHCPNKAYQPMSGRPRGIESSYPYVVPKFNRY